LYTCVWLC